MIHWRLVRLSDAYLSIHAGSAIRPDTNDACLALAAALDRLAVPGVRDVVPSYSAVGVHFDPLSTDEAALEAALAHVMADPGAPERSGRLVRIDVTYGGDSGPDLEDVATFAGMSAADVIRVHTSSTYRVYMLGFLPGFPYMGIVDARIAMPRLDRPRTKVPGGSVGIAGTQTGIYPCDSPGGWRIIGRTATRLFDPERADPFLLQAGDRVQLVAC